MFVRFYFGSNNKLFNAPRQKGRFQFRFFFSPHHGKATRLPRPSSGDSYREGYEVNEKQQIVE